MANLINWSVVCKRSLYEQLNDHISEFKKSDLIELKKITNQVDFETQSIKIDKLHKDYDEKLKFVENIYELENDTLEASIGILKMIDQFTQVDDLVRLKMLISYVSLAHVFDDIISSREETIIMLSMAASVMNINDYYKYINILSDSKLARTITKEASNPKEQLEFIKYIIDNANSKKNIHSYQDIVKRSIKSVYDYKDSKKLMMQYNAR